MALPKPTKEKLQRCIGQKMADIIAPNLNILFCGINPGLYSAAVGHHFARPGNKFWKALYLGGFTQKILSPEEDVTLPSVGLGITNFVERATASANELSNQEFKEGAILLEKKIKQYKPKYIAFLGIGAYRISFSEPKAQIGLQQKTIDKTQIWVLPNPSGLNAHFQITTLAEVFKQMRLVIEKF